MAWGTHWNPRALCSSQDRHYSWSRPLYSHCLKASSPPKNLLHFPALEFIHTATYTYMPILHTHILTYTHTNTPPHLYIHSHNTLPYTCSHTVTPDFHSHTHSHIYTHPPSYTHICTHSHTLMHTHTHWNPSMLPQGKETCRLHSLSSFT